MPKKQNENQTPEPAVDPLTVNTEPQGEGVVEPVIQTDASVPVAQLERTETQAVPLVQPTAIVPNLVYEETSPVTDGTLDAPQVITTKGRGATRVEIIYDGTLGHRNLKRGDITDDEEYVGLLKTERGRRFVREVK